MAVNETEYFGKDGTLYPLDIRFDPGSRRFFDPRPDGGVRVRVHTEPGFEEVVFVYNDGEARAEPLRLWGETRRFQYWQGVIRPQKRRFRYHIAFKRKDEEVVCLGPSGPTAISEFYFQADLDQISPLETPAWMHGAVIYQIFPERFANGDPALNPPGSEPWGTPPHSWQFQGGDLPGIQGRLDYLQELGVDVIYLNPIFTSPSNHKYDTVDYYNVDPAFGGNPALGKLVDALHQRGMRIILDASFNHCHPNFFAFKDIQQHGRDSKYWNWFTIYEYPLKVRFRPHILQRDYPEHLEHVEERMKRYLELTGIPVEVVDDEGSVVRASYEGWFNSPNMPKINLSNPEARAYFLEVAAFWVKEYKIDGWRMDVVPHVVPDFWVEMRRTVKAANPEAVMLSEVWGNAEFWLQGDQFDGTMNYTFRSLALEYFAGASMDTRTFLDGCKAMLMMYPADVTAVCQNLIGSHDTSRFLHEAEEDFQRLRLVQIFQLTMPGAPGIYYGDEIGMTGPHDPGCRGAFPWDQPGKWDQVTLEQVRTLSHLRRQHLALRQGDWQHIWSTEEALAYLRFDEGERILVVLNRQQPLKDELIPLKTKKPQHLWGAQAWAAEVGGIRIRELAPWSGLILKV